MACQVDITIIGAGVIRLTVAAEVAGEDREVFLDLSNSSALSLPA